MTNIKWLYLFGFVLIAGLTLILMPSDEKKIFKMIDELAVFCSTSNDESALETLKKAAGIAKLCSYPCYITIESFKIDKSFSQKEISDHVLLMRRRLPETKFSFHDTAVNVSDNRAEVITTLKLDGRSANGRFVDAYEIDINMKKENGDWFFSSFKVVEFMEK
ncbi:MAG: hypothetical protein ACN4GW_00845 [Desulforhopalus sp.]